MNETVLIVHGASGSPDENWFSWLKEKLENQGYHVLLPKFPTPENQTLEKWLEVFEGIKDKITETSIVIGHSLGVAFLLNILEQQKVAAAFLVAGVAGKVDNEYWEGMKTFADKQFDWDTIRNNCKQFVVYHSNNDPYITLEHAEQHAKNLGIEVTFIPDAGHFNTDSGYTEFPKLLEDIKKIVAKDL